MTKTEIPDVGRLLAPMIQALRADLVPFFLSRLERGAAGRYRTWAEGVVDAAVRAKLLECASREDEIADRVEALFPVADDDLETIDAAVPEAREAYFAVFEGRSMREEWEVQAAAERQGAMAWRGLALQNPDLRDALEGCAALEEASAACLEALVSSA